MKPIVDGLRVPYANKATIHVLNVGEEKNFQIYETLAVHHPAYLAINMERRFYLIDEGLKTKAYVEKMLEWVITGDKPAGG